MAKEQYADLNNTGWNVGSMSPENALELETANAVIARQTQIIEDQGDIIASLREQLREGKARKSTAPAQMRADRAERSAFPRSPSGIY